MKPSESEYDLVTRQVERSLENIKKQEDLIQRLKGEGKPTQIAEELLETFGRSLRFHEDHIKRMTKLDGVLQRSRELNPSDSKHE